ncbi:MAG: hypothetical protein AAF471_05810 [Myxococcota bacterium]
MNTRTSPPRYHLGLLGWPINHSLSPAMHNAALAAMGLAGRYRLLQLPPHRQTELPRFLRNLVKDGIHGINPLDSSTAQTGSPASLEGVPTKYLRETQNFVGLNITVPYKQTIVPHLDRLGPSARPLATVNTVCARPDGILVGHNTDVAGFARSLAEAGVAVPDRAVVLGAGGAAAAAAFALLRQGCGELALVNRGAERARRLADTLRPLFPHANVHPRSADEAVARRAIREFPLIVNCTPDAAAFSCAFRHGQVVCDIAAMRRPTPMLCQARAGGAQTLDGLGMLLHQAALSLALWTGREPPLNAMRQVLKEAAAGE